jgi:hypothetical protein
MALPHITPDTLVHGLDALRDDGPRAKHGAMDVFRAEPPDTPDDHFVTLFFPLNDRSRPDTEFPANVNRDRYLALGGHLRLREWHTEILPR